MLTFDDYFKSATGVTPFPFQRAFALDRELPSLVDVPTGLGKTAMAILGWLWRRRFAVEAVRTATPRRLVYCLPMRVLVEQTRDNARQWIAALSRAGELGDDVPVHVLMGGEDEPEWDVFPERDLVIIGTQDMLLSRALNRGYTASRARWPMQFGLLNTDCLWVFDEIQLMGSGLATTAQLEAFRRQLKAKGGPEGNACRSVWMSATLRPEWLETVDLQPLVPSLPRLEFNIGEEVEAEGIGAVARKMLQDRWTAKKPLARAASAMDNPAALAEEMRGAHRPGTRTIVVVNTVKRACALFDALRRTQGGTGATSNGRGRRSSAAPAVPASGAVAATPTLVLLHSRFRPPDRAARVAEALADVDPDGPGAIIISTQVIEAGVDVSAATLFTELAPWASLVQRFGRCNRRGDLNELASVWWIDVRDNSSAPYELDDLEGARKQLLAIGARPAGEREVGLRWLPEVPLDYTHSHVIRRKDLLDLFDTTPDLAGNDIDIDRYVREVEQTDVRVFWRDYGDPEAVRPNAVAAHDGHSRGSRVEPAPLRDELCPAPIDEFKAFAKKHRGRVWRWNFAERIWDQVDPNAVAPGQVFLVHVTAGGYSPQRGWSGDSVDDPTLDHAPAHGEADAAEGYEDDRESGVWQTIAHHTDDVCRELRCVLASLGLPANEAGNLTVAARWHDWGKAHEVFQNAVAPDGRPPEYAASRLIAKAATGFWGRYGRRHFRHELASALAVLQRPHETMKELSDDDLDLVAYLIAAHHGKVRLSIRSMPNEHRPSPRTDSSGRERRFARGVWDGDLLPGVDLGGGVTAPAVMLSLEPMELGLCEHPPFVGQPSWIERALRLHDRLGPFRLAYLEAILRAADERASAAAGIQPSPGGAKLPEAAHG